MEDDTDIWSAGKIKLFRREFLEFLNHCYINSKDGGVSCLGENIYGSQTRMLDSIFDGLSEGVHDFKYLKSRQLGCSTFARAFALFWLGVHDGLRGALVLDDDKNKEAARREIESMIRNLPDHVKFPRIKISNRYGIILDNDSALYFFSAGTKKGKASGGGLGRSTGLNFAICSEMCRWADPLVVDSFKPTLSKTFPNRLYIWESTALGPNLWQDMWEEAQADDLTQRAVFLGWWARNDQRLKKGSALYSKYASEPLTEREHERIAKVKELYDVDIDMEQVAWFRQQVDPSQALEDDEQEDPAKTQEQPWTEFEAFQITGSQFFSPTKLSQVMASQVSSDFQAYKFYHGTDFFHTRIEKARSLRETQLKIWQEPVSDATYIVTADPAFGHNPENNNSAVQVLRCYADCVEQVAEFADAETPTDQFAWVIAALCGYYGCGPNGTFKNTIHVIIEINGPGEAVLKAYLALKNVVEAPHVRVEAMERGIKNIFQNVRNYIYQRSDSYTKGSSLEWKTTSQLKEAVFYRLRDFLNSDTLVVRSQAVLMEMQTIIRDGESIGAPGMKRDDRTFALAMGIRCWEDQVRRRMLQEGYTRQRDEEKRKVSPADKFQIFNRNQIESMFTKNRLARLQQMRQQRYKSWHR